MFTRISGLLFSVDMYTGQVAFSLSLRQHGCILAPSTAINTTSTGSRRLRSLSQSPRLATQPPLFVFSRRSGLVFLALSVAVTRFCFDLQCTILDCAHVNGQSRRAVEIETDIPRNPVPSTLLFPSPLTFLPPPLGLDNDCKSGQTSMFS
ncbi:hypothetical protein BJV74DRAFT_458753 [Russula compacta]|nr:hypothetical protein BJV74DRAFT_458753 [Russula compacta]